MGLTTAEYILMVWVCILYYC